MIRDYGLLKAHGLMPVAGGVLDQAPVFMDAIEVIDDETTRIRERQKPTE